jgi:hypothetical protein
MSRTYRSITSIRNEAAMRVEEELPAPVIEPSVKRARKIAFFRRRFAEIRERRKFRRRVF